MPHFHSSLSFLAYYNACFILGLLLLLFYDPSRSTTHGSVLRADALMFRRKLKDVEIAANLYEEELRKAPEDSALELKLADALNTIMRIKTHSNTLLIEGLLDTPQNKRIWRQYGPKALALARKCRAKSPHDCRVQAIFADAYMFDTSTKGIIKAAVNGAASVFRSNAQCLIKLDANYDTGVGYALMGALYCVAPWPIGSLDKAEQFMEKALHVGQSQRNHYYVGVVAYRRKKWEKAKTHFLAALSARPGSPTEADFAEFMALESQRALQLLALKHNQSP